MRHALEMFDEFKYVPDHVKTETIEFSLTVLQICIRYILNFFCLILDAGKVPESFLYFLPNISSP